MTGMTENLNKDVSVCLDLIKNVELRLIYFTWTTTDPFSMAASVETGIPAWFYLYSHSFEEFESASCKKPVLILTGCEVYFTF